MKKSTSVLGIVIAICVCVSFSSAIDKKSTGKKPASPTAGSGPFSTLVNINNISMWISYDGASARNPSTGNSGVTYPRGTATSIYADGFLWGGQVHDGGTQVLRVNGGTYQQGNVGGRIISKGVAEDQGDPSVRIYRIRRDYLTADLRLDAAEVLTKAIDKVTDGDIAAVRDQYAKDWAEWPASKGAPFYDKNNDGVYDPNVDEPGVANADQVVWFVINDLNSSQSRSFLGADPMGMEVQVTLWGYARSSSDQLGNVIFKRYRFIYKGTASGNNNSYIDNMYVGQWADPDLGDYSDDYVGCDTTRTTAIGTTTNLGFVYNSTTLDRNYSSLNLPPPAMGYDFFAGPIVPDPNGTAVFDLHYRPGYRNLGMSSWIYFAASGTYSDPDFNYAGGVQWYNLLRGLTPVDGSPFIYPDDASPTKFWLSGDPVSGTGNLDGTIDPPGDRRMMQSSGPFTMNLGDTQEVVVAMVGGLGADRLSSISVLRYNDVAAQYAFNALFQLPYAPPSPRLRIAELDRQLILDWGSNETAVEATEGDTNHSYYFQGYNVYQLPSPSATVSQGIKLATFDLVDNVTTITDNGLDPASGQVLPRPVEIGKNSGIVRHLTISTDKLRTKPLVNGQPYYFAVTAYNYNPSGTVPTHSYESPLQVVRAVPQSPNPGVRYSKKPGDTLQVTHSLGNSDGMAVPIVIDPTQLTGHLYKILFSTDTVSGQTVWSVVDSTTGHVVLANQSNQTGDDNYPFVNGVQVKVMGPQPGMKEWSIPVGVRHFSPVGGWAGLGLEGFGDAGTPDLYDVNSGTIGMAGHFAFGGIGTTLTNAQYHTIVLKLAAVDPTNLWDPLAVPTDTNFSKGYRWLRHATFAPGDPSFIPWIINPSSGYAYQDFNYSVPFSAWDMETNPPTRLAVGMFENNDPGASVDGRYWPPNTGGDNSVNREFCFIFAAPYSTTPNPAYQVNLSGNASLPMEWVMTCARRNENPWPSGDEFQITANHVNTSADVFSFVATGNLNSTELAKADVTKINVFPNPYYGYNAMETSRFQRFVTFNHLPPGGWQIRIISLSGNLVRYIDPNSNGQNALKQFATWDLTNQSGLPVASGIYIAYIDMPGLGVTKTLKVVIIQEQQVLDYY
jgi:hypothetical protein